MDDFIDDDDYEEDSKAYSKCIRKLFNYDPRKYKDIDDDDIDNMETDFHSQLKEEKRR
jgi:protein SPT2